MSLPATSTVLATLLLQIQDNINSGQTTVNRTEPQFSYQAQTANYANYQTINGTQDLYPNVSTAPLINFLYVRNVTQLQNATLNQVIQVFYSQNSNTILQTLIPGGWMLLCNPSNPSNFFTTGITDVSVRTTVNTIGLVEYLYAV